MKNTVSFIMLVLAVAVIFVVTACASANGGEKHSDDNHTVAVAVGMGASVFGVGAIGGINYVIIRHRKRVWLIKIKNAE